MEVKVREMYFLALKIKWKHESRNVGSLQKLEKARKLIALLASPERTKPTSNYFVK
jgi:hypothetical protein